ALVKTIAQFPDEARRAAEEVKPHALANYAYHLASVFNDFYRDVPVLKAEEDVQGARLALVDTFRITCRNTLELLGIEALRKM
ncbi:MAG: DALR anticodon-binding domain-containing protein, partial [Methanopyri archaeon]|nr:DALR anticodon-binding domain-containing protein [Methanopyri archaeon]